MKKNNKYKIGLVALKFIPILMALSMLIHCILIALGIDLMFAETIMGCALFPSILILCLSGIFEFCYIHKALTIYSLIVDLCININRYIGFGILKMPILYLVIFIGLVLFTLLIIRIKKYKYSCVNIKNIINKH